MGKLSTLVSAGLRHRISGSCRSKWHRSSFRSSMRNEMMWQKFSMSQALHQKIPILPKMELVLTQFLNVFQRRQIHQKQEWLMEFCCSCFRVQMHKPLVHDSQRASIYHQGTEASLLELGTFMTLRGLGVPDSPNTTGWPPLVFQGLAPMDQLSKSRTKNNLQAK